MPFSGLCGRNNPRPCKLVWSSGLHPRVGTYPSDFLPSKRTIWHAITDGGYTFNSPVISPGETFGLPSVILGGLTASGTFSGQSGVFTPSTRIVLLFARTSNRLNVPHILSQSEINSIDPATGIGEINVGEYVFDAVAVTDQIEVIDTNLTNTDRQNLQAGESEQDRAFRKLFQQPIPDDRNRLIGVKVNSLGIEYRLDNGDSKSISAMSESGTGAFVGASATSEYRDASSKILKVNLTKITTRLPTVPGAPNPTGLQAEARVPKVGDVVYLTYVAVREHYIRQSVSVKWTLFATSIPPQCIGLITNIKVASYRFYTWNVQNGNSTTQVSGWRAVESHSIPVNFVAPVRNGSNTSLGDFIIGGGTGQKNVQYMPAKSSVNQIQSYQTNRSLMPTYSVNLLNIAGSSNYHVNSGVTNPNAYQQSDWFKRKDFSVYDTSDNASGHVFFNVHQLALSKRDVDKFGIERFLAQEIEKDILSGKKSFFPFMDDPNNDFPVQNNLVYLDNTNTKFSPIEPVTKWTTSNAEVECATGGGVALNFTATFGDVFAAFDIVSPIINERFEKDTRVLIEKFGHEGHGAGNNIVAIEGLGGAVRSVSCLHNLLRQEAYATHINSNNLLAFNAFEHGYIFDGMRSMEYRPDIKPIVTENPLPKNYERFLGYDALMGDPIGYINGQLVECSHFLKQSNFYYKTTSKDLAKSEFKTEDNNITVISFNKTSTSIDIPVGIGTYGETRLFYSLSSNVSQEILVLFKQGGKIVGSVDSLFVSNGNNRLIINHRWFSCDSISIVGDIVSDLSVTNIIVTQLKDKVANDFLNEQSSSTVDEKDILEKIQFDKSVLFRTEVMSIGQDTHGRIFVFFEDKDGGISCAQSNDDGLTWSYFYGIVEPIKGNIAKYPFVLNATRQNKCFLFFYMLGKVLCKPISYDLFKKEDAFIIERFEKDRLYKVTSGYAEKVGLLSDSGKTIRRKQLSYVAGGDLTDLVFLDLLGKNVSDGTYIPTEKRQIDKSDGTSVEDVVYKNPISIGTFTGFTNSNISDAYFSAYRSNNGTMRLFFMGDTVGGGRQLQCNFSTDNGITWYDNWEFADHSYNRLRNDKSKTTNFIDFSANGVPVSDINGTDPFVSQIFRSGINLHWSRLRRHKKTGTNIDINSDSLVLLAESPYVFFHSFLGKLFIFYVYSGCLLCKIVDESIFTTSASTQQQVSALVGLSQIKKTIERDTRAYFIDGNLTDASLREELHYYVDSSLNERQSDGNIIFTHQFGINTFNSDRNISAQRVCAYRLSNCDLRVLYKHDNSNNLRAAIWTGTEWYVEDLMKTKNTPVDLAPDVGVVNVTGGFGNNSF